MVPSGLTVRPFAEADRDAVVANVARQFYARLGFVEEEVKLSGDLTRR